MNCKTSNINSENKDKNCPDIFSCIDIAVRDKVLKREHMYMFVSHKEHTTN